MTDERDPGPGAGCLDGRLNKDEEGKERVCSELMKSYVLELAFLHPLPHCLLTSDANELILQVRKFEIRKGGEAGPNLKARKLGGNQTGIY